MQTFSITAGALVLIGGVIWAMVRAFKSSVKSEAQNKIYADANEQSEEAAKIRDKVARRGPDYTRELLRKWMRKS